VTHNSLLSTVLKTFFKTLIPKLSCTLIQSFKASATFNFENILHQQELEPTNVTKAWMDVIKKITETVLS